MRRVFVLAAVAALVAACSYDWDEFSASDGGDTAGEGGTPGTEGGAQPFDGSTSGNDGDVTVDATAPADGGADVITDAGCTPSPVCLADAGACGAACGQTSSTCQTNCGNKMNCKNQCRNAERQCRADCAATCVSCTQAAGCVATSECDAAAHQ